MIGGLAFLLMGAAAANPATDVAAAPSPDLFISTCLDGQSRLSSGAADAISFADLPHELRQRLGKPQSAQVWHLRAYGRAYLYIIDYDADLDANPRICGLASDYMNYNAARELVQRRLTGEVDPMTERSVQWLDPKRGYKTLATTVGDFRVLQVNWLSNAERLRITKAYQQITPE